MNRKPPLPPYTEDGTSRRSFFKRAAVIAGLALGGSSGLLKAWAIRNEPQQQRHAQSTPSEPDFPRRELMEPDLTRSLRWRNLAKPIEALQLIDDMETDRPWASFGIAQVGYAKEHVKSGTRALRLSCGERDEEYIAAHRKPDGSFFGQWGGDAGVRLDFETPQDWSDFNRLSLWVYVGPTRIPAINLVVVFHRDIAPGGFTDPVPFDYEMDLLVDGWNHLYWDIPEFERSQVTGIEITKNLTGYPGEPVNYDIDRIEIQRVDVEPYQGWEPGPGKIAYLHIGYRPSDEKLAITAATEERFFELLNADTGDSVARHPVKTLTNRRGAFAVLDFSDATTPGRYVLKCGDVVSESFPISDEVWHDVIAKGLNYFLGARCGFAVPGLHNVCHQDITVTYKGETKIVNGGWHDAGDAGTQNPTRTAHANYALLQLYDRMGTTVGDSPLRSRVLEEVKWGLDYLAKIRFEPGVRGDGGAARIFTDNRLDTLDDIQFGAGTKARMASVLVSAYAARLLERVDNARAAAHLEIAEEDYATAPEPGAVSQLDAAAEGAVAAIQLWLTTGKDIYQQHAKSYGRLVVECQQQHFDGLSVTGYFHESTAGDNPVDERHDSDQDVALRALRLLGETFPDDPEWMKWYGTALLYAEYFHGRGAETTEPYRHVPNRVWRDSEIPAQQEAAASFGARGGGTGGLVRYTQLLTYDLDRVRQEVAEHYDAGVPVGPDARLLINPLYVSDLGRGNAALQLAYASGIVESSILRNKCSTSQLARMQLQWVLGGNPFSQSLMYGEGYNYAPLFGNDWCRSLVGGVPVGMSAVRDIPYCADRTQLWPRETWIIPPGKIMASLAFLALPAKVTGSTNAAAVFCDQRTGVRRAVRPGKLDLELPPGDYEIEYAGVAKRLAVLGGASYALKLDHRRALDVRLSAGTVKDGSVTIQAQLRGSGSHSIELRTFNGRVETPVMKVNLKGRGERTLSWTVAVADPDIPWAVVAIPDRNLSERQEAFGTCTPLADLS